MYSIAHIIAYFLDGKGHWPDYIDWYMASCKANPTVDFYIFTDSHQLDRWDSIKNIHIVHMSFEECKDRIEEKFGTRKIGRPYKLCDYKTVYGILFEDWVKEYDFWALGDCDLLLGDLRAVFTDEFLDKYDRFQVLGNLQIIRNTKEINDQYLLKRPEWSAYKEYTWERVISREGYCGFDEWTGLPFLVKENGGRIYWNRENFTNIYQDWKYKKMLDNTVQENTLFQYWLWENGKIYHVDKLTGKRKERLYIHFSNRKLKTVPFKGQNRICMTVNSEFKEKVSLKDTFEGMDFFRVYSKKIKEYIIWHIKHPKGNDKRTEPSGKEEN